MEAEISAYMHICTCVCNDCVTHTYTNLRFSLEFCDICSLDNFLEVDVRMEISYRNNIPAREVRRQRHTYVSHVHIPFSPSSAPLFVRFAHMMSVHVTRRHTPPHSLPTHTHIPHVKNTHARISFLRPTHFSLLPVLYYRHRHVLHAARSHVP